MALIYKFTHKLQILVTQCTKMMSSGFFVPHLILLSSLTNVDAQDPQLTAYYGQQATNSYSALNQGRITSFGAWKCWVDSTIEWKFRDWTSDQKTISNNNDNYGNTNQRNVICSPFTLASDDFIVGYTIYINGNDGPISGLTLNTRNGVTYSCICLATTSSHTQPYNHGTYDF